MSWASRWDVWREDAPCRADDGKTDAEGDTEISPGVGRYGLKKGADVEGLAAAGEEHV